MNKASEKNGNGEQENIGSPQSINQSINQKLKIAI